MFPSDPVPLDLDVVGFTGQAVLNGLIVSSCRTAAATTERVSRPISAEYAGRRG